MIQEDILQKPVVALVILSWNGKKFLEQFLLSIVKLTYQPLDIYIADNASTDDSIAFIKQNFPSIHIISLKNNEGFAKGYNIALKEVVADYYFLVNQDVEVTENCIEPLLELMESDMNIAACQPKILSFNNRDQFEYAGAAGGYLDKFGYVFCRGRIFGSLENNESQYQQTEEIFWASGAAFFIRAELFKRFKGFDGDFVAHMEEIDLCWRLKRAGYKIMYVPDSVVYHVGGGSLASGNPHKTYLNYRNNLFMMFKNYESSELIWKLPVRIGFENAAFFKSLFERKWGEAFAIFRADWHFAISLPFQLKKRFDNWRIYHRNRIDVSRVRKKGYYGKSIVWQYFINKKRKFTDL
ncbi:MAG: glycosyltransferase family 2 protein [Chitinophagales bacterium]